MRQEIGASDEDVLVGIVGRLTEIKNISLFLKVAKLYKELETLDFPRLKFIIIGDGNLRTELEAEAKTLGIEDVVKFLGNRNDTDVFYAGLDIVALTSLNEGTPLSLIEAMANEKAVISTAVGGVVDLLGEVKESNDAFKVCERGISVASDDAVMFYQGLIYLAKDENLRLELGDKGKKYITARYSKERLVRDIMQLYRYLKTTS